MPERQGLDVPTRVLLLERSFDQLQTRVDKNAEMSEAVAVLRTEFRSFTTHIDEKFIDMEKKFINLEKTVGEDVGGLRRTLITTGGSMLVGAIVFAITTLAVFGAPG